MDYLLQVFPVLLKNQSTQWGFYMEYSISVLIMSGALEQSGFVAS